MVKIIMHGCNGHMGQVISGLVEKDPDAEIVAGIDVADQGKNSYPVYTNMEECQVEADALIDFSSAKATDALLAYCEKRKLPIVLCTTGLSEEQLAKVEETSENVAVLKSANMSLGINTLMKLLQDAAKVLAAEIGCTNTHFATPNGLDAGYNHYTTASDLAKIAQYAIKKPMFRKLVSTGYYSFSNLNTGRSYSIGTTNALLGNVPGVQGMKTGYTNKAGYCFVGLSYSARGNTYISVVLGADSSSARWQDSRTLLTYAYNH